ncbi:hypothetical protein [Streptacidiphilus albus]|uniref:hypothetical protein n=1 Tax=Streptacidiphilus albus TaxID=105425 RepID=UPI000693ABD5|nr:hypothetical protein [Streptacidiphilus albus]
MPVTVGVPMLPHSEAIEVEVPDPVGPLDVAAGVLLADAVEPPPLLLQAVAVSRTAAPNSATGV